MAYSFGNHNQSGRPANGSFSYSGNYQNNRNFVPPVRNPAARPWFRYDPRVKVVWTAEENAMLEECLVKIVSDCKIARYAKISKVLQSKTVRDVAVRYRMRMRKQIGKRRKVDGVSNGRKERVNYPSASSSRLAGQPGLHANGVVTTATSYSAIGGAAGQLFQQNDQAFEQISANLRANKFHENIGLLSQARENILKILANLNDAQEAVELKRMPPLPVVMNEELSKLILPPRMNPDHTNN